MPPPSSFPDIDDEIDDPSMGQLIADAMNTMNNMTNVCNADRQDSTSAELRLIRTILEWLECTFARQEAKLDKLLQQTNLHFNQQPPPPMFSTPDVATKQFSQSAEYLPFKSSNPSRPSLPEPTSADPDWILYDVFQQSNLELAGMTFCLI